MDKTILIPTDLQVGSLNTLKACLAKSSGRRIRVILMHAMHAPDGIGDLLFYSRKKVFGSLLSPAFNEAVAVLHNRFEQCVIDIEVVPFHGRTQAAFDQFLAAKSVHEVHFTSTYTLRKHKAAFDPMPFVLKSRLPQVEHGVTVTVEKTRSEAVQDHLQLLFES